MVSLQRLETGLSGEIRQENLAKVPNCSSRMCSCTVINFLQTVNDALPYSALFIVSFFIILCWPPARGLYRTRTLLRTYSRPQISTLLFWLSVKDISLMIFNSERQRSIAAGMNFSKLLRADVHTTACRTSRLLQDHRTCDDLDKEFKKVG